MKMNSKNVTLLTDFGTEDGYVGAIKGVLLSGMPDVRISDISHRIQPFNIRQAAFALLNYYADFPAGTVHLLIIDPGVGTSRKGIIVRTNRHYFICPDNGVLSYVLEREVFEAFRIKEKLFGESISPTFHGRDIFAPAAIKILSGEAIDTFAEKTADLISFYRHFEKISETELRLQIAHVDHFGNLILNFTREDWEKMGKPENVKIQLEHGFLHGIRKTFGSTGVKELVTTWDSCGFLQIAQNKGNAAQMLQKKVGDQLILKIGK